MKLMQACKLTVPYPLLLIFFANAMNPNTVFAGIGVEKSRRWPGNCIPYEYSPFLDGKSRSAYVVALDHWNTHALPPFCQRNGQKAFVLLGDAPDSKVPWAGFAETGYSGGKTRAILKRRNLTWEELTYVALHEMAHVAGLLHEHQRCDRDNYVELKGKDVDYEKKCCFLFCDFETIGGYDLDSVTHYRDPKVVKPKGRNAVTTGGCLSFGDLDTLAKLYGTNSTVNTITCPNGKVKRRPQPIPIP